MPFFLTLRFTNLLAKNLFQNYRELLEYPKTNPNYIIFSCFFLSCNCCFFTGKLTQPSSSLSLIRVRRCLLVDLFAHYGPNQIFSFFFKFLNYFLKINLFAFTLYLFCFFLLLRFCVYLFIILSCVPFFSAFLIHKLLLLIAFTPYFSLFIFFYSF